MRSLKMYYIALSVCMYKTYKSILFHIYFMTGHGQAIIWNSYVMRSSKMSLNSKKKKKPSKLSIRFQRYRHFSDAQNIKIQRQLNAIIGCISKLILASSGSFCLITSHMYFHFHVIRNNLKEAFFVVADTIKSCRHLLKPNPSCPSGSQKSCAISNLNMTLKSWNNPYMLVLLNSLQVSLHN